MSYAHSVFHVRVVSKAQFNGVQLPGRLHHIALILAGFAVYCSQIRSQTSWLAGRSAAWLSEQAQAAVSADSLTKVKRYAPGGATVRSRGCGGLTP
jgi:hypothetical protein